MQAHSTGVGIGVQAMDDRTVLKVNAVDAAAHSAGKRVRQGKDT